MHELCNLNLLSTLNLKAGKRNVLLIITLIYVEYIKIFLNFDFNI